MTRTTTLANQSGDEPPPQEKLLKYFPAEALALYSGLEPLAKELGKDNPDTLKLLLWSSLIVALVFCVLFLRRFWQVQRTSQLAISAGSLVLYVAALGEPFATIDGYKPLMGVAAAIIASAFLIFVPTPSPPQT